MKIKKLQKSITINGSIAAFLLILLFALIVIISNLNEQFLEDIKFIKSETMKYQRKTTELEGKVKDAIKYHEIWTKIEDNKKDTRSIKIDDVNGILTKIGNKYGISDAKIKMLLPNPLEEERFKRQILDILGTDGTLSFKAIDDVSAISFIEELRQNIPGHFIVTFVEFAKIGKYNSEDLLKISRGQSEANLNVNVRFSWYSYRDKKQP